MSELTKVTGKEIELILEDKVYKCSVLTVNDIAEFESYAQSQKLQTILKSYIAIGEKLDINSVDLNENWWETFAPTTRGTRYILYLALKKSNKITLDEVGELITTKNTDKLVKFIPKLLGVENKVEAKKKVK